MRFDELKTPAYVIDEKMLIHNLEILHKVEEDTGRYVTAYQTILDDCSVLGKHPSLIVEHIQSSQFAAVGNHIESVRASRYLHPALRDRRILTTLCRTNRNIATI